MVFSAFWQLEDYPTEPYLSYPGLRLEGGAPRYVIDWGDGATEVVKLNVDFDGDGINDTRQDHQYADGTYNISISQGGRGPFVDDWQAVIARQATADLRIVGSNRLDYILTGSGDDFLHGMAGDDVLLGGAGNDRLVGGAEMVTGSDNDALYGGLGDDILIGGAGDDVLQGNNGRDRLRGGTGDDIFAFARPRSAGGTALNTDPDRDTVVDFHRGDDKIDLSGWSMTRRLTFIGADDFNAVRNHGEVRVEYNSNGDTVITGDAYGDGTVDFTILLIGHVDLTRSDFIF